MWFRHLHEFLRSLRFKDSRAYPSLFIRINEHTIFVLVYVDDIIITGFDDNKVQVVVDLIGKEFAIRRLGDLEGFKLSNAHLCNKLDK